ncbi:betaine--homocysteine S-methyltransferase [Ahrensia sp. R2A130]|uniref:betaine--homocysteine S-methyltransferase n=1 Tax=Ahrensia sp. R2A130 TaxID=744979 RepID=UPI0001E0B473|nr:betaine--homocysteine S-methyltransferase [Ahrensia sp. R2A130]EFL90705.1 methionine synthase I [Ahrensia sp. R2A130]
MGRLRELLDEKGVLLADGATGTNFFNMGLLSGDAPELWNEDEPEKVMSLHQGFVDAGADIILTNTFGANRHRLKLHHAQERSTELNEKAAKLARKVADAAGRPVLVAGSVGPTGELFEPLGELTREAAIASFTEQMIGLRDGGADVMWIETMSAREEIDAAADAAEALGLDFVFTASFDTAGRTMMGITPTQLMEIATTRPAGPIAIGANCGVGATDLLFSILDMTAAPQDKIAVVAKANCGVPRVSGDKVIYTGTPELMADYARYAIDAGAAIIGGCCGTSYEHLAAMRGAIDTHKKRKRPELVDVVAATGPLVNEISTAEQKDSSEGGGRRRGGRRR